MTLIKACQSIIRVLAVMVVMLLFVTDIIIQDFIILIGDGAALATDGSI